MARYVTVASVSLRPEGDMDRRVEQAAHFAWRAKQFGADILAFPETYVHTGLGEAKDLAEVLPGPSTARMAEAAKKHAMYIVWPLYERRGGTLYNSAVLIDRRGQIAGVYRKMHPTIGEIESRILPGEDTPTFETDFGRVGMAICFDLNFRDIMTGLAESGAEVIFFCSAYRGGMQVRYWAFELGVYMVSSILAEGGQIVDLTGTVLEQSTYESLITRRINLNRRLLHMDYNWDKMDKMLEKYGGALTFDYVTPEACYAVGCTRERLHIDTVLDEFGLERRRDYFERANRVRAEALARATR